MGLRCDLGEQCLLAAAGLFIARQQGALGAKLLAECALFMLEHRECRLEFGQ